MVTLMKKINYIGTIAIICISFIGCIKENEIHNLDDRFVIYATREDLQSTKTELQSDNSIVWTKGDEISLFVDRGTNGGYKFVSTNEANASSTTFISSDNIEMNGSSTYWAVYPYNESTSCNGASITTILPSEQVAKAGSFDEDLFISVAKSNSNSMFFKNVCGGIKFSVANEGIKEVIFKSNNGSMISGVLNIAIGDNGVPEVKSISDGKDEIKVIAPENGTFAVGENYYVVIPPVSFPQGITLKYITSSDQYAETVIESSSVIERSVFSRLMEKDYCATFKYNPYLVFYSEGQSSIIFTGDSKKGVNIEWSNNGEKWNKYTIKNSFKGEYEELSFSSDKPLYMRGYNPTGLAGTFTINGDKVRCKGNLIALIDYQQSGQQFETIDLFSLFGGCKQLVHAPDMTGLNANMIDCSGMFYGCTSLQSAPTFPSSAFDAGSMFSGCTSLVTVPNLPANNMQKDCYKSMFYGCTSLVKAPDLPALILAESCYEQMFYGCSALKEMPNILATSMAGVYCCREMFKDCTSLTGVTPLYASEVSSESYMSMFEGCSSLTITPEIMGTIFNESACERMFYNCTSLIRTSEFHVITVGHEACREMFAGDRSLAEVCDIPANKVESFGCCQMFDGCSSLKKAPEIQATIIGDYCYYEMFSGCSSLTEGPSVLPAMHLKKKCYYRMFYFCTSLIRAPKLPSITEWDYVNGKYVTGLAEYCYEEMFRDCKSLTEPPELPSLLLNQYCYLGMFKNCISLKTAPALPANSFSYMLEDGSALPCGGCYSSMFEGCTSLTDPPVLHIQVVTGGCYENMFKGCISLITPPDLPSTQLDNCCYQSMFEGCTSLIEAPDLPAVILKENCYNSMFKNCYSLVKAPELGNSSAFATANWCCKSMFENCKSLESAPILLSYSLSPACFQKMFKGCSNLKYVKALFRVFGYISLDDWLAGVSPTGTFVKNASATWNNSEAGIPDGWTVEYATE